VNRAEPCLRTLEEADPDVFLLATQYHLLDTTGGESLFPKCLERGVRVVVGSPFGSGILAGGGHYNYQDAGSAQVAARDRIAEICERHGIDIKAAALQFSAAHPAVAAVIPGAKRPDRIPQNVELMKASIPADLWTDLEREGLLPPEAHTPA
jgi:D-threo-aldose 1-dehydrogenase